MKREMAQEAEMLGVEVLVEVSVAVLAVAVPEEAPEVETLVAKAALVL